MIFLYLFGALLLLIILILIARIRILVDTEKGTYAARFGQVMSIQLVKYSGRPGIRFRAFFISFRINGGKQKKEEKISMAGKHKRKKRKITAKKGIRYFKVIWQSIHIRKLTMDIDTGDFPLNAQLIPLALALSRNNVAMAINFEDRIKVDATIQTRLITLIWNYILTGINK